MRTFGMEVNSLKRLYRIFNDNAFVGYCFEKINNNGLLIEDNKRYFF